MKKLKLAQYTNQERIIASADSSGIRQRWLWGLRLLADREKVLPSGRLRDGVIELLIAAAAKRDIKLSRSEIQYRMQAARAYKTEAQLSTIVGRFATWTELRDASFPDVPVAPDEPAADWRTAAEKYHDIAKRLLPPAGDDEDEQLSLFPLSEFEPSEATLKDLADYLDRQEKITQNFAATQQRRKRYHARMLEAVGGDLSTTWAEAHRAVFGNEPGESPGN